MENTQLSGICVTGLTGVDHWLPGPQLNISINYDYRHNRDCWAGETDHRVMAIWQDSDTWRSVEVSESSLKDVEDIAAGMEALVLQGIEHIYSQPQDEQHASKLSDNSSK